MTYNTMNLAEARAYAHLINIGLGAEQAALAFRKRLVHGTHAVTEVNWDGQETVTLENATEVFAFLYHVIESERTKR